MFCVDNVLLHSNERDDGDGGRQTLSAHPPPELLATPSIVPKQKSRKVIIMAERTGIVKLDECGLGALD